MTGPPQTTRVYSTEQLAPLDDPDRSVLLFPAFPVHQWNVRFKLHAPLNTTIEASCQGGVLEYLRVTPHERAAHVKVAHCEQRPRGGAL